MTNSAIALELALIVIAPETGKKISASVIISTPYAVKKADFACSVEIRGLEAEEKTEIYGIDSLQALILSLRYLEFRLIQLKTEKYRIESESEIDPLTYFDVFKQKNGG